MSFKVFNSMFSKAFYVIYSYLKYFFFTKLNYRAKYTRLIVRTNEYRRYLNTKIHVHSLDNDLLLTKLLKRKIKNISSLDIDLNDSWWKSFFAVLKNRKAHCLNNLAKDLMYETSDLNFRRLNHRELLEIYALCIEFGLYESACIFRTKINKKALKCLDHGECQHSDISMLIPLFESNNKGYKKFILNKTNEKNTNIDYVFLSFFLHKLGFLNQNIEIKDYLDPEFDSLVRNRRVAIVGPAINGEKNGNDIDSYDIVIRFNYKGEAFTSRKEYIGERTDVSYYNFGNMKDIRDNYSGKIPDGLIAAVFKLQKIKWFSGGAHKRVYSSYIDKLILNGHANALEYLISDLLLYSPSKIKVFSLDMRLSNEKLNSYGTLSSNALKKRFPNIDHDPFSQFTLMKRVYEQGLIDVDNGLKKVLSLDVCKYMEKLQAKYITKAFLYRD